MASCHECNSQVGENDVFCPFCGVKVQTVSEPSAELPEVNSNATTEPSMTDIPIPSILAGYGDTSDNIVPESTSEFSMEDEIDRSDPARSEEKTAEEPIPDIALEMNASEEEIPQVPADAVSIEEPDPEKPGLYDVREVYAEKGISRPLEELKEPEQPRSMFDSVRIMESKPPEEADTRIQGTSNPLPDAPVPSILSEPSGMEPKPYTEPNLGRVDTDGKRSGKLKPLTEGTILNNRYEIVRKIGGGGMGAVYLASDNNLGGVLRAVKEMVQSHIEEEQQEKAINDFKRESMILSTLDHPSIPTIYDYFYEADEGRTIGSDRSVEI